MGTSTLVIQSLLTFSIVASCRGGAGGGCAEQKVLPHEVPLEPPSAPWSELVPGRRASLKFERRFEPNAGLRVYQVPTALLSQRCGLRDALF